MYWIGIDIGSTQSKGVILDENQRIVGRALTDTGVDLVKTARNVHGTLLSEAGVAEDQVHYVVATGYGRYKVTYGDSQVSEISCHARGAKRIFPGTKTVVDIGGQDTKAIKVGPGGEVVDFSMNDKCAAGTGRFLTAAAYILDLPLDRLGEVALRSQNPARLSSTCTVFVESEIIAHLSKGRKPQDIVMGMHVAITNRCVSLMSRVGIEDEITFTGGVSRNIGMVKALEEALKTRLNVSPDSQFMGAIGAAAFAVELSLTKVGR